MMPGYIPIEYPKWVDGVLVQNAAEENARRESQAEAAAAMYSPIVTAKMNHVDPQVWLSDVLSRIAAHPMHRLDELLLWNWTRTLSIVPAQAA